MYFIVDLSMDVILDLLDDILESVIGSQPPTVVLEKHYGDLTEEVDFPNGKIRECTVNLERLSAEVLGGTVARVQAGARKSCFQIPDPVYVGESVFLCPTKGCHFKAGPRMNLHLALQSWV